MRTLYLFAAMLFLWLMPGSIRAQTDLLNYIPPEASVVVGFHFDRMDQKVNLRELRQLEFMDLLEKELIQDGQSQELLTQVLSNPYQAGIDLSKTVYFFSVFEEDRSIKTGLLMHVEDFTTLEGFLEPHGPAQRESLFSYIHPSPGLAVAWSRQVMLFTWGTAPPAAYSPWEYEDWDEEEGYYEEEDYDEGYYDEDGYWHPTPMEEVEDVEEEEIVTEEPESDMEEEFEAEDYVDPYDSYQQEQDSILFESMEIWTQSLLANAGLRSLSTNTQYTGSRNSADDISIWLDYSRLAESPTFLRELGLAGSSGFLDVSKSFVELIKDSYLSMGVSFEKGEAVLRSAYYSQPELLQFYRATKDAKVNKRLARYVKQDDLLGYTYFNYNSRNFWEGLQNLILPELEKTPFVGEMVRPGLDVLGILIDQDAIYNLFKGDALVAFHGLQPYEKEEFTYEYDDDFNYTERLDTVVGYYPEFVYLMSYGNEDDVRKLLRLGEASKVLRADGEYVYRVESGDFLPFDLFFRLDKGVLVLSNNEELAHTRRGKGFRCKDRLGRNHRRMMSENSTLSYWDIPAITRAVASTDTGKALNLGPSKFSSVTVTSPKTVDNSVNARYVLKMNDDEQNSLEALFGMINKLILEQMGGYGS